jgi:hypothetical protein
MINWEKHRKRGVHADGIALLTSHAQIGMMGLRMYRPIAPLTYYAINAYLSAHEFGAIGIYSDGNRYSGTILCEHDN